ncbi:MAG: tryptophan--tRNA ligase [Saprospiraceae bacterium]|uniref:Tryptophan--tRNA ligase n=1 Tax=Candidatus Opimibacter skivensis TaxID=2982028 RepID=A0A9D7SYJ1_9BACT|nr:tryptophan--tRNA ligase [Candidatus Opimibacter skivensis]
MSSETQPRRKQVLSGIQPTGDLHLGRYFGAVKNWVDLQEKYDCIYCVVDYHALTMPFNPKTLRDQVWKLAFDLIAVGLEPKHLFIQSMIPEHTELAWIFNCLSSYGEVSRMTQFKDKSQQINEKDKDAFISTGLFTYPVLQAADILIYRADYVPVGKDQDQHLELSRNIAQRFNQIVGQEYFVLPETLYTEIPKVMSTSDPLKKMSASLGPKHFINIFSEPDAIRKQIKTAVTDSGDTPIGKISPGVENLFLLLEAAGGKEIANSLRSDAMNGTLQYGKLKETTADYIIAMSDSFREKRKEIEQNPEPYIEQVKDASVRIRKQAQKTIMEVKDLIGLQNVRSI